MATISIDLDVPDNVIALGAIQLYAKSKGWTELVIQSTEGVDENGNPSIEVTKVPNPVEALDYAKNYLKLAIKNEFKTIYMTMKASEDSQTRSAEFESLFA